MKSRDGRMQQEQDAQEQRDVQGWTNAARAGRSGAAKRQIPKSQARHLSLHSSSSEHKHLLDSCRDIGKMLGKMMREPE